jgi:hypothetical protein
VTIAALYVQRDGAYYGIPDVDPWDEARDARRYPGPWPVVAHPPCKRWCALAGLVEHRYGYRKGDDLGCFAFALLAVRSWGGVLEHPAWSRAWPAFGLFAPSPDGGWTPADYQGGWTCQVEQGHHGHRARKATWLLVYGAPLPSLPWGKSAAHGWVSWGDYDRYPNVERLGKRERAATPPAFRDVLLSIARSVPQPAVGVNHERDR